MKVVCTYVSDAEQIFSFKVLDFFESKGYSNEAKYVRVIRNWRRATNERSLTDDQRSKFNQELLSYILDELMLWHSNPQLQDFSVLEPVMLRPLYLIVYTIIVGVLLV